MARSTSTGTARTSRRRTKADEATVEATETTPGQDTSEVTADTQAFVEPQADGDQFDTELASDTFTDNHTEATQADDNGQEANVSTETVEAPEATSDTTEATAPEQATTETKTETVVDITAFEAAVATALAERDATTGTLPEVQVQAVTAAYRELNGAKNKNAAKSHLNDVLRDVISKADIQGGQAVMTLVDATQNVAPASRATAERKPVDPAAVFVDSLTVLHLAYTLRRADVPEGVNEDEAFAKVDAKVTELSDDADRYYAWVNSKAEDKGDEPEVDAIVKKAVKAAQGRAASVARGASATPRAASDGVRRNVRTHIAQVFADLEPGTFLKMAEIANKATEEYPEANCSSGAITAAIKSDKGVEGFQLAENEKGNSGIRKL